jgi:hypothetical protein
MLLLLEIMFCNNIHHMYICVGRNFFENFHYVTWYCWTPINITWFWFNIDKSANGILGLAHVGSQLT